MKSLTLGGAQLFQSRFAPASFVAPVKKMLYADLEEYCCDAVQRQQI